MRRVRRCIVPQSKYPNHKCPKDPSGTSSIILSREVVQLTSPLKTIKRLQKKKKSLQEHTKVDDVFIYAIGMICQRCYKLVDMV